MHDNDANEGPALAKNRTVELLIAGVLLVGSLIVILDSIRLGFGWRDGEGPAPGYFPFWVALILGLASAINFLQALLGRSKGARDTFVSRPAFGRVLAVLIPAVVFVAAVGGLSVGGIEVPGVGLYVASAMFITGFMTVFGLEGSAGRRLAWAALAMVPAAVVTGLYLAGLLWLDHQGVLDTLHSAGRPRAAVRATPVVDRCVAPHDPGRANRIADALLHVRALVPRRPAEGAGRGLSRPRLKAISATTWRDRWRREWSARRGRDQPPTRRR